MKLSANFDLSEFLRSEKAARMGIVIEPSGAVVNRLQALCVYVLEPMRAAVNRRSTKQRVVHILSGYRPPEVNELVGGSKNSQHIHGEAADCVVSGLTPAQVVECVRAAKLPVDQCILEFDQWVHVSYVADRKPRRQYLRAISKAGKTVYLPYGDENSPPSE